MIPSLAHFQHPGPRQVGQHRDVVVPAAKALFIDPDVTDFLQRAPRQAPLDRPFHDPMNAVPIEPQQRRGPLHVVGGLEHPHGKRLEQQREPRMLARPGNGNRLHAALRAVRSWRRAQHRLELHRVQVPPGPLRSMVGHRAARHSGHVTGPPRCVTRISTRWPSRSSSTSDASHESSSPNNNP